MTQAGLIPAAGASSRMGYPKALVEMIPEAEGVAGPRAGVSARPWVLRQAVLLAQAGCRPVMTVLGSEHERIIRHINRSAEVTPFAAGWQVNLDAGAVACRYVVHPRWRLGRTSSVLAGLRALFAVQEGTGPDGCVILPVDTAGIKPQTMQYIVSCAMSTDADVLRPVHAGHSGQVIWISRACALRMLKDRGLLRRRLDDYFKTMARELPVDDAHILNNINRTVNP